MSKHQKYRILLQSDPMIMRQERNAIKMASMTDDQISITRASLADVKNTKINVEVLRSFTPIGSVEFCQSIMNCLGIKVPLTDAPSTYPESLKPFLGRDIKIGTYGEVPDGQFCKSIATKIFTGHIKEDIWSQDEPMPAHLDDVPVYMSEKMEFAEEYRLYVTKGDPIGLVAYIEGAETGLLRPGISINHDVVLSAMSAFETERKIDGYTIDFGLLSNGKTVVLEWNDGWAIGYYRDDQFSIYDYLDLVSARWHQIISNLMPN